MQSTGLKRRRTQREVDRTSEALNAARGAEANTAAIAAPAVSATNQARAKVHELRTSIDLVEWRVRLDDLGDRPNHAVTLDAALDTWARWASGQTTGDQQLGEAVAVLWQQAIVDPAGPGALANAVAQVTHVDYGHKADWHHLQLDRLQRDPGLGIDF